MAIATTISRRCGTVVGSEKKPASRIRLDVNTINRSRLVSARAAAHPSAKHHATTGIE